MNIYTVFHYDDHTKTWIAGNVYYNRAEADEEAKIYNGYVLTKPCDGLEDFGCMVDIKEKEKEDGLFDKFYRFKSGKNLFIY